MLALSIEEIEDYLENAFPLSLRFGAKIESLSEGHVVVRIATTERNLRPGGTVSGPMLMTLADTTMFYMLLGQIGRVAMAYTTNLNMNFLRTPKPGDLIATGHMLKLGKRLAVGEIAIRSDGSDEVVAHATITYSIPTTRE